MSVVQEVLQDLPADESLEALAVIPNPELEPIEVSDGGFIPEIAFCYFYGVDEEGNLIETPMDGEKDPQEEIFGGGEYKIQPYWGTLTGGEENTDVVEFDADGNPILHHVEFEKGLPIWWDVAVDPTPTFEPPLDLGLPIWWDGAVEPNLDENGNLIETPMDGEKDPQEEIFVRGEGEIQPYWRTLTGGEENTGVVEFDADGNPILYPIDPIIDDNGWPIWWCVALEPTLDENGNPIEPVIIRCDLLPIEGEGKGDNPYVDENGNPIQTLGGVDPVIDPIVVVDYIDFIAIEVDENGNPIQTLGGVDPVIDPVVVVDYIDFIAIEVDENGWPICTLPEPPLDENGNTVYPVFPKEWLRNEVTVFDLGVDVKDPVVVVDPVVDPVVVVGPCDPIVVECRPYVDEDGNQIYTFGGVEADPVLRNLQVWLADDSAEEKAEVKITRQKDISFTVKSSGDEVAELSWDDLIHQRVDFHSESAESSFTMKSGDHRYVHGKIGSDKIKGGKGDDWLDGNGGKDSFNAGKGDDHILVDDAQVRSIDGGKGDDTLVLRSDSGKIDLTHVKALKGIETIDLLSGSGNGLSLTLSAKQLFKNHVETVKILGDSFDTLVLQGEHVQLQTLVADPEGFSTWHVTWKGHETTLLIDSDINVV